ncbi:SGNH/GDSL hydrolase family protein [Ignavibacteriales bacterium]
MKKIFSLVLFFAASVLVFTGCEDRSTLNAPAAPSTGTASFTRYVAIGNSLTAGYQSGSLYESAQKYSYAKLIADQVGTTFAFPNVGEPGTKGRLEVQSLSPFVSYANPGSGALLNATYAKPYNNLGVPGALIYDFVNAYDSLSCFSAVFGGSANPMFNLVLRNQGGAKTTQWLQTKAQQPTFVTFWLGSNDILGHATQGGAIPYTPVPTFTALYNQAMDSLKTLGCPVAVGNILDVTMAAYFTTVGGQLQQQGVTAIWGVRGTGDTIPLSLSKNLITLTASAELAAGKGLSKANPLGNRFILDSAEIVGVKTIIAQYNTVIKNAADARGFVYVDVASLLTKIGLAYFTSGGYVVDGVKFTPVFVTGNLFSLDGVHPTSQAHALVANEFITAINAKYNGKIPLINVGTIPGSLIFKQTPSGSIVPNYTPEMFKHILF